MNLSQLVLSEDSERPDAALPDILSAIRQHLHMDVAFVSEFIDGRRVFRQVDAADPASPVKVDGGDALEDSYCQRVVDGRLPLLMTDARKNLEACTLPVTHALPVGAHISLPIRLSDGTLYGTFCAFSFSPDESLNERDLQMMRVFADLAARLIERERSSMKITREASERIQAVLDEESISTVYQPIFDLGDNSIIGLEALSRFSAQPLRTPDVWFHEAGLVGLGAEMETLAIKMALRALDQLPSHITLGVNMSPAYVLDGSLENILRNVPLDRITLEITEHAAVQSYQQLAEVLAPFRARGLKLAVDDAGAGYASFRHILNLAPDRIKLDISITKNIDTDPSRRALAAAFIRFASDTGSRLIAEGVETASELDTLQQLGVGSAQGNFLSAPLPLAALLKLSLSR